MGVRKRPRRSSAVVGAAAETVMRAWGEPAEDAVLKLMRPRVDRGELIDEGEIGAGGSGSVRKAYDPNLRREVATKVLATDLVRQPADLNRFVEEARLMARLDHPNIVPVHDLVVEEAKSSYIVMKLVRGRTLEAIVTEDTAAAHGQDGLHHLLSVFLKVCDALAFAHSRRVIHCDLKPSNIMVGEFGEVYLMDWGIAEAAMDRAANMRGSTRGTPAYMSPEQATGQTALISERTDIFGLGGVLYFILTGRGPFDALSTTLSLSRARACKYVDVDEAATIPPPPGLVRIVRKAMASNPADRFGSVIELRDKVDALLRSDWSLPTRVFAPGTVIVKEGEWADVAYIIVRGRCAVYKTVDGKIRTLRTLQPGAVFGEAGILSGDVRTATVEAIDEVMVKLVTRELFQDRLGSETWFGKFVLALADRFRELDQKLNRSTSPRAAHRKR